MIFLKQVIYKAKKRKNLYHILFIFVSNIELKSILWWTTENRYIINMLVLTDTIIKIIDNGI